MAASAHSSAVCQLRLSLSSREARTATGHSLGAAISAVISMACPEHMSKSGQKVDSAGSCNKPNQAMQITAGTTQHHH